jgi:hypothetical protein
MLEKIHVGKKTQPPRILIYGAEGIGKSSVAATFPKPIFIATEDGLGNIDCASFPICKSFNDVILCLNSLVENQHEFKTVVIDSVTWLQTLIFAELCTQHGVSSIEKVLGGYSKGYIQALTLWEQVLELLQRLRLEKRMIVLLLGHTEVKKIENPEVSAFDQFMPNLHHKASEKIRQWCDLVLFATREFGAAKGEKSGGQRILRCENSPMCIAKSRFPIPEILPMSWPALAAALYPKKETKAE